MGPGTGRFCLSAESQNSKMALFRPVPRTLFPPLLRLPPKSASVCGSPTRRARAARRSAGSGSQTVVESDGSRPGNGQVPFLGPPPFPILVSPLEKTVPETISPNHFPLSELAVAGLVRRTECLHFKLTPVMAANRSPSWRCAVQTMQPGRRGNPGGCPRAATRAAPTGSPNGAISFVRQLK